MIFLFPFGGIESDQTSGQIIFATSTRVLGPQKVAEFLEGTSPAISGKSRLVKKYFGEQNDGLGIIVICPEIFRKPMDLNQN